MNLPTNIIIDLFYTMLASYVAGAVLSLLFGKEQRIANIVAHSFAALGGGIGTIFAIELLLNKLTLVFTFDTPFPLFKIFVYIDALSAFFVLIISIIATAASIYGIGYMQDYAKNHNVSVFGFFYNLFLVSLILVVTSYNALYFLFVWEIMSLTSLFLVMFEYKEKDTMRAGLIYFVMTHIGTMCILASYLLIYTQTNSFDFNIIKGSTQIPMVIRDIVFVLGLIGFGTKAGIIPFHIWLPRAHSAAPSHVSALMSGVMIKMGIFMIIRMFVDIIPQGSLWWGFVILIIGGLSSLLGVLYALAEHDIKRLLAYHSIENIGIILLGVGSAMIFNVFGAERLAAMALIAALFHTINHALFKSLLFFGAGSVISKTHTRDIEEYGGLIKTMPYTAVFFLIGAVAISGLPPFNGFASEWLTFQSLFAGISAKSMIIKSVFMFGAASLAFTGGLAAACFVKAFGITFLARPRSIHAEHAKESDLTMQIGMGIVAFLCLILGILSGRFTNILTVAIHQIGFLAGQGSAFDTYGNTIVVNNGFAVLNLAYVFMGALLTLALTALLVYLLSRNQKTTIKGIWDCGFSYSTSRMEITSTGFARSLILVFRSIFRPQKEHEVEYSSSDSRYFTKSRTVTLSTVNVYETYFYYPTLRALNFISAQVKKTQNGNVNLYLFYITVILIGLLIWSRFS